MKVKAISIWQPWASLIAMGAKKYETRSWATSYRGSLLICAAKRIFNLCEFSPEFKDALFSLLPTTVMATFKIPFGQAVAIADLMDCQRCGPNVFQFAEDRQMVDREKLFGNFSPGRYAWKFKNVRPIASFPVKGKQALFEVELPFDI